MAYTIISQNNTTTTLSDENGNVITVPARVTLATSTDYTIIKVNNNSVDLEDGDGKIIRGVPACVVLAGEGGGGTLTPNFDSVKFNGLSTLQSQDYYLDVKSQYYLRIGTGASLTVNDLLIRADTGVKTISFGSSGAVLGDASSKFARVYTEKLNNGADIAVPTTGGTMAVIGVNTTATLAVADWSSNTQTVTVSGVKADSVVFVSPAPASASDYASAGILCTSQSAGTLTFTATTTPSVAIVVNIVCL